MNLTMQLRSSVQSMSRQDMLRTCWKKGITGYSLRHARKHIPHITQCDVKVKGVLEYPNPEIPSLCRPYPEETYIEYPITVMLESGT
jgi:hypothetical protein